MLARSGYRILEHPADLGIEATAPDLRQAFEQAAVALMSVILDLATVREEETRSIIVAAVDREQLLVKWLTEVLYLYDGQRFVGKTFGIEDMSTNKLVATVCGEPLDLKRHDTKLDVKAVTYHQILVTQNKEGAAVRVFFDI